MHKIISKIEKLVNKIVDSMGFEVVDIEMGKGNKPTLSIFVYDPKEPISVYHLRKVSKAISAKLDVEDIMVGKYYLVVSSPGLDRPLKSKRDFERNIEEPIKITELDGTVTKGKILSVKYEATTDFVVIENAEKGKIDIPIKDIKKGLIQIIFKK